jgi:hypothetical protein
MKKFSENNSADSITGQWYAFLLVAAVFGVEKFSFYLVNDEQFEKENEKKRKDSKYL